MEQPKCRRVLTLITIAQLFCTSLWFSGNAVVSELIEVFHLNGDALGHLTAAVQFGFVAGTLVYALLNLSDRYSPSTVFFYSALIGALFNVSLIGQWNNLYSLMFFRFMTGFMLAGVYPVGMKIVADYYQKGIGKALGFVLAALVTGTALPHLLRDFIQFDYWYLVIIVSSVLAITGGWMIKQFVFDGPYRRPGGKLRWNGIYSIFKVKDVRAAAYGYFGHMWELYTFWMLVPVLLRKYYSAAAIEIDNISLTTFLVIASGGIACISGGYLSQKTGIKRVAVFALMISGLSGFILPFAMEYFTPVYFLLLLFVWGFTIIPDSPMFSSLVAINAPPELKGTALTIINSIGFLITIGSIELINYLLLHYDSYFIFWVLLPGPIAGLISLLSKNINERVQ